MAAGHDPFEQYFERDFTSGEAWWELFGDRPVQRTILGFAMRQTWGKVKDEATGKTKEDWIDKPVMDLAEMAGKPVFINRGMFESLREILGPNMAVDGGKKHAGKVLVMSASQRKGRDGMNTVIAVNGLAEKQTLGAEFEARFNEGLTKRKLSAADFIQWLRQIDKPALADLVKDRAVADWPPTLTGLIKGFMERGQAGSEPAGRQAEDGRPGFWKHVCRECGEEFGGAGVKPQRPTCPGCKGVG